MHSLRRQYQEPLVPLVKQEPQEPMLALLSASGGVPGIPPTAGPRPSAAFSAPAERSLADVSGLPSPSPSAPPLEQGATGARPKKKRKKGKKPPGPNADNTNNGVEADANVKIEHDRPHIEIKEEEPIFVKPEPQSPVLGSLTLYDPMPAYNEEDELELGEISEVTQAQKEILAQAAEQNLIMVMEDDFDVTPLYLMKAYKGELRPTLFLIPSGVQGRLDSWIDIIALRCTFSIGVIDAPVIFSKELSDIWSTLLTKNVILASSEALLQAVQSDVVWIENFSLIIVDECHRVHSHVPYHQIFLSYFTHTALPQRPAVFGLTTEPYNIPEKFNADALLVEEALSAHVWGISDAVRDKLGMQMQLVMTYAPCTFDGVTPLYEKVHEIDEKELVFKGNFESAKEQMKELGPYAADMIWRRHAASHEIRRAALVKSKSELSFSAVEEARTKLIDLVKAYTFPLAIPDPSNPACNVAPKLATLVKVLEGFLKQDKGRFRGIVLVNKRSTAKTLADVLRALAEAGGGMGGLRPRALVGNAANMFDPHVDHLTKAQATTQMKEGTINLLVTTGVAFDLDVAPLSVLIRFDVFDGQSAIQIQQSRIRKASKIHLIFVEEGKKSDLHATADLAQHEYKAKTQSGPQAPLRRPRDGGMESDGEEDDLGPYLDIKGTSTRFYASESVQALIRYISIQEKTFTALTSEYDNVDASHRLFTCTLRFPESADLKDMTSAICTSKAEARRDVAFKACQALNDLGRLENIVATANKKLKTLTRSTAPMVFDADEGVKKEMEARQNKAGVRTYPRKRPDMWRDCLLVPYDTLFYPSVIVVDPGVKPLPGTYRSMCILTRLPLPTVQEFDMFFPEFATPPPPSDTEREPVDRTARVRFVPCAPVHIPSERMESMHRFTIRTVRCCTSRAYICPPGQMTYYFLPLLASWSPDVLAGHSSQRVHKMEVEDFDWAQVREASANAYVPLDMDGLEQYTKDTIIQDREIEFTRRYHVVRLRRDLTPLSKPADSPREQLYDNILEYCRAKRKGFEGLSDETQPLFEVERTPPNLNRLCPTLTLTAGKRKSPAKYLIPEMCVRYTLCLSVWRTVVLLPSILSRLETLLMVQECNERFCEGKANEVHMLHALTTPSVLAEFNYERLELLGDSYLKYLSSIYLFVTCPRDGEGALHILRQRIISNRALLFHADRVGLPQYVQSKLLNPRQWWPPNYRMYNPSMAPVLDSAAKAVFGTCLNDTTVAPDNNDIAMEDDDVQVVDPPADAPPPEVAPTEDAREEPQDPMSLTKSEKSSMREESEQQLGDKCVADVAEAVIGAAFITAGKELALTACKNLGLPLSRARTWADLRDRASIFFGASLKIPPKFHGKLEGLERLLGHKFKNPFLLVQAMTHGSATTPTMPCYERLEFLGDAILDFLVVRHIFLRYGELLPGSLTLLKGAMVCNTALAAACVDVGLYRFVHHDSTFLDESIARYVVKITKARDEELQKAKEESRPPGEYWVEHDPPKVLSDIVEAVLGAACVSESFADGAYEGIFDRLFGPFFLRHVSLNTLAQHPTKILFERLQQNSCNKFEVTKTHVSVTNFNQIQCDVVCHDKIIGTATENSVVLASRHACADALKNLEEDPALLGNICKCREDNIEKRQARMQERVQAQLLALAQAPIQGVARTGSVVPPSKKQGSVKAGQKRKRGDDGEAE